MYFVADTTEGIAKEFQRNAYQLIGKQIHFVNIQCSLANANSVKAKFRITRILTTSPCIAPIKTCTIKVLLSRIPLNKKFCLTSTSSVEPFVL